MTSSRKIRDIMDGRGMTQIELARATGMKRSNVCKLVHNDRDVRESTLSKLCRGLGCKPEDIMGGVE